MADSGLVCYLLNIRHAETFLKGTTLQEQQFGRLVETWAESKIQAIALPEAKPQANPCPTRANMM